MQFNTLLLSATTLMGVATMAKEIPVDQLASSFQMKQQLPGLVVASVAVSPNNGKLLSWTGAYGHSHVGAEEPMLTNTSLWLASLTKPFTGTAMTKAKEEGILSFPDLAADILSKANAFALPGHLETLSLEDLATHRSTIVDNQTIYLCGYYVGSVDNHTLLLDVFGQNVACVPNSPVLLGDMLEAYLSEGGAYFSSSNFGNGTLPGEKELYSNFGAALAGYLVGLAAGTDLPSYSTKQLFAPLGMKHTSFLHSDFLTEARIATPYSRFAGAVSEYTELPVYDLATYPDGGLRSSVDDIAKFMGAIMNGGVLVTENGNGEIESTKILEPESVKDMITPRDGTDHGIFWFVTEFPTFAGVDNRTLVGHNGGDPGAFSNMFFDPDTKTGFFVAGNGEDDFIDPTALGELQQALMMYASELQDKEAITGSGSDTTSAANEAKMLVATVVAFATCAFLW